MAVIDTYQREFNNGERVLAGYNQLKMVVEAGTETLRGWRYKLRFLTRKGEPDKRRKPLFFYADNIIALH